MSQTTRSELDKEKAQHMSPACNYITCLGPHSPYKFAISLLLPSLTYSRPLLAKTLITPFLPITLYPELKVLPTATIIMAFNTSNLSRVQLIKNPHYKRNGMKSYAYLLHKCKHLRHIKSSQSTTALRTLTASQSTLAQRSRALT